MSVLMNHFGIVDYIVVAVTLLFSLFIGVFFAMKKQTTEDLLVGGRSMGALPVAASMMVTYFSAISILGSPAEIFYHGMEMFMMTIVTVIFAPMSAFIFVPVFFDMKLTSVFLYFQLRFDSVVTRLLASLLFILQTVFISAVVLYAPSIALESLVGIPKWLSIVGIGICCSIYTSIGGLRAVVWTDVFQLVMILIGMGTIVTKGLIVSDGLVSAFETAGEHGRINLLNFTVDPFMRHNTLNFLLGFGFTIFCMIGCHQPQVQRYSSLPTKTTAIKAILMSIPINIVAATLVLITGISIFSTYADCDPLRKKEIQHKDQIVPYFVKNQLSFIPGMLGLFISCIFSAVLSTISSMLNSLSAVTMDDFFMRIPEFRRIDPKWQAHISRIAVVFYGVVLICLAFLAQNLGALLPLVLTAVGATTGPLAGTFLMGLFFPFVNKYGAISGMITGMCFMFYLTAKAFQNKQIHLPLPTSIEGCLDLEFNINSNVTTLHGSPTEGTEWPDKLYTLSYLLYPVVGALITAVVGTLVSAATGGFCTTRNVNSKYLHGSIRNCKCVSPDTELQMKASIQRQTEFDRLSRQSSPYSATNSINYYPYNYEMIPNGENVRVQNGVIANEKN